MSLHLIGLCETGRLMALKKLYSQYGAGVVAIAATDSAEPEPLSHVMPSIMNDWFL